MTSSGYGIFFHSCASWLHFFWEELSTVAVSSSSSPICDQWTTLSLHPMLQGNCSPQLSVNSLLPNPMDNFQSLSYVTSLWHPNQSIIPSFLKFFHPLVPLSWCLPITTKLLLGLLHHCLLLLGNGIIKSPLSSVLSLPALLPWGISSTCLVLCW